MEKQLSQSEYNKKVEMMKKCEKLRASEKYWFLKTAETVQKLKGLVDPLDQIERSVENLFVLQAHAIKENALITNSIEEMKQRINNEETSKIEATCFNHNQIVKQLEAEYNEENLLSVIKKLEEENNLLILKSTAEEQHIQEWKNKIDMLTLKADGDDTENDSHLDEVMQTLQNQLKSKAELKKTLEYHKNKKLILDKYLRSDSCI